MPKTPDGRYDHFADHATFVEVRASMLAPSAADISPWLKDAIMFFDKYLRHDPILAYNDTRDLARLFQMNIEEIAAKSGRVRKI